MTAVHIHIISGHVVMTFDGVAVQIGGREAYRLLDAARSIVGFSHTVPDVLVEATINAEGLEVTSRGRSE